MSTKQRIPFGQKNGRMVTPLEVPSGVDCGCCCPACNGDLVAVNKNPVPGPRQQRPHFRHAAGTSCTTGAETAIHRMAKQVLIDAMRCLTPRAFIEVLARVDRAHDLVSIPGREIPASVKYFTEMILETPVHGFIPDVTGFTYDGPLHIEILVTHAVNDDKAKQFAMVREDMFEIDLSGLVRTTPDDFDEFKRLVLHEENNRHWIYCRSAEVLEGEMLAEQAELLRQRDKASLLSEMRDKHPSRHIPDPRNLYQLYQCRMLIKVFLSDFEYELANHKSSSTSTRELTLSHPIGFKIKNDWVIKAPRVDWQRTLVNKYLHHGSPHTYITVMNAVRDIDEHYCINPAMKKLADARRSFKQHKGIDILTKREKSYLPAAIVIAYFNALVRMGYLCRENAAVYRVAQHIEAPFLM